MADLLGKWVNQDVALSIPIRDFEADFANGFYLGELLHKLSFLTQREFDQGFENHDHPNVLVSNFTRLGHCLKKIGIKFNSQMANNIMGAKAGAALRLVYQLKMAVTKLQRNQIRGAVAQSPSLRERQESRQQTMEMLNRSLGRPQSKHTARAHFDKQEQHRLHERLELAVHQTAKERRMADMSERFTRTHLRNEALALQQEEKEAEAAADARAAYRNALREQQHANKAFKQEWEDFGRTQWRLNQKRIKKREKADVDFQLSVRAKQERKEQKKVRDLTHEVQDSIHAFERNLERIGADQGNGGGAENVPDKGDGSLTSLQNKLPNPTAQAYETQNYLQKIKEKTAADKIARKEREMRRRKMMVDQQNAAADSEARRRQALLMDKLARDCQEERRIAEELWRTRQYKEIIRDNRRFRDRQEAERRQQDYWEKLEQDRVHHEAEKTAHAERLKVERERYKQLNAERAAAKHEKNVKYCKGVALRIVDLAIKTASYRDLSDQALVPPAVWREWMRLFTSGSPLLPAPGENVSDEDAGYPDVTEFPPEGDAGGDGGKPAKGGKGKKDAAAEPDAQAKMFTEEELFEVRDVNRAVAATMAMLHDVNEGNAELVDEAVLEDYLAGQGEWTYPVEACSGGEEEAKEGEGEGKQSKESKDTKQEASADGEGEGADASATAAQVDPVLRTLGDGRVGNAVLGSMVEAIVDVASGKFLPPPGPLVPKLPVGICLLGKPFAGKKTQAELLGTKHALRALEVGTLVQEAVDDLEAALTAFAAAKGKKGKKPELTERQTLGEKAKALLSKGKAITDDLYADLVAGEVCRLKMRAQAAATRTKLAELRAAWEQDGKKAGADDAAAVEAYQASVDQLQAEITAAESVLPGSERTSSAQGGGGGGDEGSEGGATDAGEPTAAAAAAAADSTPSESTGAQDGHSQKDQDDNRFGGWVLVGFPETLAQAELLEKALTGYEMPVPLKPGAPTPAAAKSRRTSQVAPPPPSGPKGSGPASGIDLCVRIDGDNDVFARRALGRRVDPETGKEYHLDSSPPDEDEAIKARLTTLPEHADLESQLPDRFTAFEEQSGALEEWFGQFKSFHALSGTDGDSDAVATEVSGLVQGVMDRQAQDLEAQAQAELAAKQEAADQAKVADAKELEKLARPGADGADTAPSAKASARGPGSKRGSTAGTEGEDGGSSSSSAGGKSPAFSSEQLLDFSGFRDMDLATLLSEQWVELEQGYASGLKHLFRAMRLGRRAHLSHFATLRKNFLRFLRRPDNKMQLVETFQSTFNALHPDLRLDPQAKDELHQRTDELGEELWSLTDARKTEAEAELTRIREDGWEANRCGALAADYAFVLELELRRYVGSVKLARDLLAVRAGKAVPKVGLDGTAEAEEELKTVPFFQGGAGADAGGGAKGKGKGKGKDAEPANASGDPLAAFDASCEYVQKAVYDPEEVVKQVLAASADPAEGSGGKDKKGKGKKDAAAAPLDLGSAKLSPAAELAKEQLRSVVVLENQLLASRVARVKAACQADIARLKQYAEEVFLAKLDKWLGLRIKGESAAIETLCHVIKTAIEDHAPLHYTLTLEGEDVFVEKDCIASPLPELPSSGPFDEALSSAHRARLTAAQVRFLADACRTYSAGDLIAAGSLANLLLRLCGTSYGGGPDQSLPAAWSTYSFDDFRALVDRFATTNTKPAAATPAQESQVNWREFVLSLALPGGVPTPSLEDLQGQVKRWQAADSDDDGRVTLPELLGTPLWWPEEKEFRQVVAQGLLVVAGVAAKGEEETAVTVVPITAAAACLSFDTEDVAAQAKREAVAAGGAGAAVGQGFSGTRTIVLE